VTTGEAPTLDQQADLRAGGLVADVLDRWTHPSGSYDLLPLLSFEKRRPRVINFTIQTQEAS
jgi:hypothetical protein